MLVESLIGRIVASISSQHYSLVLSPFLNIPIYADSAGQELFRAFDGAVPAMGVPIQELVISGDAANVSRLKSEFCMLQEFHTDRSNSWHEGEDTKYRISWHQIEDVNYKIGWFFRNDFSFEHEINFILYEKAARRLTFASNAEELYGKKQLSVMIASLLLFSGPYFHVHGSSASIFGHGILFIGKHRAGKSSFLREIAKKCSPDFIALTDNATLLDNTRRFSFIDAPFSNELRIPDVPASRELLEVLINKSEEAVPYYSRNNKLRISLPTIRRVISLESMDDILLDAMVVILRAPENNVEVYLEEIDAATAVTHWQSVMDEDWVQLWDIIPVLERVVKVQTVNARMVFEHKQVRIIAVTLPREGKDSEALAKLISYLGWESL
ncbi:MAG TPA: hypothetical protein VMU29_01110 [Smithella sp.]|nr:hypothetical protein [Smithella sp.]